MPYHSLETWYQELLDDANAIENEGLRDEAITDLGSPESFIASLKSQYVTPIITGIQRSAEALETRTANRLAQGALKVQLARRRQATQTSLSKPLLTYGRMPLCHCS